MSSTGHFGPKALQLLLTALLHDARRLLCESGGPFANDGHQRPLSEAGW